MLLRYLDVISVLQNSLETSHMIRIGFHVQTRYELKMALKTTKMYLDRNQTATSEFGHCRYNSKIN